MFSLFLHSLYNTSTSQIVYAIRVLLTTQVWKTAFSRNIQSNIFFQFIYDLTKDKKINLPFPLKPWQQITVKHLSKWSLLCPLWFCEEEKNIYPKKQKYKATQNLNVLLYSNINKYLLIDKRENFMIVNIIFFCSKCALDIYCLISDDRGQNISKSKT